MNYPDIRLRRLRKTQKLRDLFSMPEPSLKQMIYPVFVIEGMKQKREIISLPEQEKVTVDLLPEILEPLIKKGLGGVLLFGVLEKGKNESGTAAFSENGLIQTAVQMIKIEFPDFPVFTDVCLCSYTNHGHCGLLDQSDTVQNDQTLKTLQKTALSHAFSGADGVAPSAMMDGQVQAIRHALDKEDFKDTLIMSYSTKFSSSLYGPFRDAANSSPKTGNRKTYQAPFNDLKQALRESLFDEKEGADILMIKPALFYLDIIARVKEQTLLPVAAYNVSGEYSMIYDYCKKGYADRKSMVLESLTALKRAGADIIISYWAKFF